MCVFRTSAVKSDGTISFTILKAARLDWPVAEAALKLVQSVVEGVRGTVRDRRQFCQHPVLHHLLQGDKLRANNGPCL